MAQAKDSNLRGSRARRGADRDSSRAFEAMVAELIPGMLVRAGRMLRSNEDARDALQEALLVAFTKLDQLRNADSFPGWFKSIVDSRCRRRLRTRGREISLGDLDNYAPLASKSLDPATAYERSSFRAAANRAFRRLSPALREVCLLYYDSGRTVQEIADLLSLKRTAVRKRLHSAQPLLADILAGELGEVSIRVGYLPISDHLLGMVAHRMSRGRNSAIIMKRFLSWSVLAEALEQRRIDAAFIMAPLAMQLCNSGTPLKYILDGHHDGSALATSAKTLRGKLVGVPGPYSTHRVLLGQMANEFPKLWGGVDVAHTNPSYAIRSLKEQVIDAFFCAEPWSTKCASEGGADVIVRSRDVAPGHPCCVVAVREDFCKERPEVVDGYVRLLLRAREKLHADIHYCAETQAAYTGIQSGLAARVLEERGVTFDDLRPDKTRMAAFMRLALDSGVLSSPCDLDAFVAKEFF